jgi:hypothetical protein
MGVDFYNQDPHITSAAEFDAAADATGKGGEPVGIEAHRRFAASHGLPLVIPEWGNDATLGDAPAFVTSLRAWIEAHAGRGPGLVLYENVFALAVDDGKWALTPATRQPRVASAYEQGWVRPGS